MDHRRFVTRAGAVSLLTFLLTGAGSCDAPSDWQVAFALQAKYLQLIQGSREFSIHIEDSVLPAGTTLVPDIPGAEPATLSGVTCNEPCKLIMLDLKPRAHFAHDVIFAVYEIDSQKLNPLDARWWPYEPNTKTRFFNTVKKRRKSTLLCSPDCDTLYPPPSRVIRPHLMAWKPGYGPAFDGGGPTPRRAWAVVVNGYDSPEDTFDKDTEGMFKVLTGLGFTNNQICYLTDNTADPDQDASARPVKVETALKYIAQHTTNILDNATKTAGVAVCGGPTPLAAGPVDEFFFFMSTHGSYDPTTGGDPLLSCNHLKDLATPPGGLITDTDLRSWISRISASHITIVIEACQSGAFKSKLATLPQCVADPNACSFFFSAGANQDSFTDLDPPMYSDKNPGDTGSETIWGFIEAFGSSRADVMDSAGAKDMMISFGEAVKYADDHDATPPATHASVSHPPAPDLSATPFLDLYVPASAKLKITNGPETRTTVKKSATSEFYKLKSPKTEIMIEVGNPAGNRMRVGMLQLRVIGPDNNGLDQSSFADTVILSGMNTNGGAKFGLTWQDTGLFASGSDTTIEAIVDSPQAPAADDVNRVKTADAIYVGGNTGGCRTIR